MNLDSENLRVFPAVMGSPARIERVQRPALRSATATSVASRGAQLKRRNDSNIVSGVPPHGTRARAGEQPRKIRASDSRIAADLAGLSRRRASIAARLAGSPAPTLG